MAFYWATASGESSKPQYTRSRTPHRAKVTEAMIRLKYLQVSVTALAILLCGCSSKPGPREGSDASASRSAPAKPQYDFGTVELSPTAGSGREATVHVTIKPGSQRPSLIGLLFQTCQCGGDACYVFRDIANNENRLLADNGSGWVPHGKGQSVANRQCELLHDGTASAEDAWGIKTTFHIRFRPGFQGAKHIWAVLADGNGNGPEMKQVGDWTVK